MSDVLIILDKTKTKAEYLSYFSNHSFESLIKPDVEYSKHLFYRFGKKRIYSLFSIGILVSNVAFMEAVYEMHPSSLKHSDKLILSGYENNDYYDIPVFRLVCCVLNELEFRGLSYNSTSVDEERKIKKILFRFVNNFSYYTADKFYLHVDSESQHRGYNSFYFSEALNSLSIPALCYLSLYCETSPKDIVKYFQKNPDDKQYVFLMNTYENRDEIVFQNTKTECGFLFKNEWYAKKDVNKVNLTEYLTSSFFIGSLLTSFKKENKESVDKILSHIFSHKNKNEIVQKLEDNGKKIIHEINAGDAIKKDRNHDYVMLKIIKNGNALFFNQFIKAGYKLNTTEMSYLQDNPELKKLLPTDYKNNNIDDSEAFSLLVHKFNTVLQGIKNDQTEKLNLLLSNLSIEKKTKLFQYIQDLCLSDGYYIYSGENTAHLRYNNLTSVDMQVSKQNLSAIMLLHEHGFVFNTWQIYEIGKLIFVFTDSNKSISDYEKNRKLYLDFLSNLSLNQVKTMFIKNCINKIEIGSDIEDDYYQNIFSSFSLTSSEIDLILNTDNCNYFLMDKILKSKESYFSNPEHQFLFLKHQISLYNFRKNYSSSRKGIIPSAIEDSILYIMKRESDFSDQLLRSGFKKSEVLRIQSRIEQEKIKQVIKIDETDHQIKKKRI